MRRPSRWQRKSFRPEVPQRITWAQFKASRLPAVKACTKIAVEAFGVSVWNKTCLSFIATPLTGTFDMTDHFALEIYELQLHWNLQILSCHVLFNLCNFSLQAKIERCWELLVADDEDIGSHEPYWPLTQQLDTISTIQSPACHTYLAAWFACCFHYRPGIFSLCGNGLGVVLSCFVDCAREQSRSRGFKILQAIYGSWTGPPAWGREFLFLTALTSLIIHIWIGKD